jgi:hypothetical protein
LGAHGAYGEQAVPGKKQFVEVLLGIADVPAG